jgi:predicted outer membrane repeat protein
VVLTVLAVAVAVWGAAADAASAQTWTVDTTEEPSDANCEVPGKCSLREALKEASASDSEFPAVVDATQVSGTIDIAGHGTLQLTSGGTPSISVEGPGPGQLTIDGGGETQLFRAAQSTQSEASLSISGMTLANGHAGALASGGGAIEIGHPAEGVTGEQPLTVENVDFVNNEAPDGSGGAIEEYYGAKLTLIGCTFEGNRATDEGVGAGLGGAISTNAELLVRDTQVGTITGGNSAIGSSGGGILVGPNGSLTMDQGSAVEGNTADVHGGGIYAKGGGSVTMYGSSVSGNVSQEEGGGIYAEGGNVAVTEGSSVDNNSATGLGGGIYAEGGFLSVFASSVEHNQTQEGSGGGIFATGSSAPISVEVEAGSAVADNQAQGFDAAGGGIYTGPAAELTLADSTVEGNSSSTSGGGIYAEGTNTEVSASTISGNLAKGAVASATGGGIDVTEGGFTLIDSTVAENVIEGAGSHGGGVGYDAGGGALIANSTIAGNSASGGTVGGLLAATDSEVGSTIIAGNTASGGCPDAGGGGLISVGWNIVGEDTCGFPGGEGDQLGVEPGLGPLQDNGGPTDTMAPAAPSSPAINRGSNGVAFLSVDQRGETRSVPAGSSSTDVGAYEVQAPIATTPPAIAGTPTVGQTLTCEPGTWNSDHVPPSLDYTWTSGSTIVATSSEYEVAPSDEGGQLVCEVAADNGVETVSAESAPLDVPTGQLAVSPTSLDFGTQQTGTESAPRTVAITNSGGNPLELDQLVLTGSDAGQFSLTDACSGTTIAAGGECQVEVLFAPGSDGGDAATLEIPSSAGSEGVTLSGIGRTPAGALSIDPASLDFGTQQTGTASGPRTVTLSNSGDAALTVGQLTLGGAGAGRYSIPSDGCSGTALAPDDECQVQVVFAPDGDGGFPATLEIPSSSGTMQVELAGIGRTPVGALSVAPSGLDFGTQQTGTTSAQQTVTVANTGDAPLTLGQPALAGPAASQYSLVDACSEATLAPGGSCLVNLTFAPSVDGPQVASLEVPSSVGTQTISLGGTGQTPSPPAPPVNGSPPPSNPTTAQADLRVELSGPHRAVVGKRLEIRLTIANRGPQAARDVVLTAKLTGVALEGLAIHGAKCRGERELVCAIGSLAPGHRRRLEITATPRRADRLDVTAGAGSTTADPNSANDRDQWPVKIRREE